MAPLSSRFRRWPSSATASHRRARVVLVHRQGGQLLCFRAAVHGQERAVVIAFDPLSGQEKDLLRIPLEGGIAGIGADYSWQLSPDGSWIAIVKRHGHQIRLVPLGGGPMRTIIVKGHPDLQEVNWATDSQSMFVSSGEPGAANLLHVGLNGDAQPVWQQPQPKLIWGFPSPDGHHLAILGAS